MYVKKIVEITFIWALTVLNPAEIPLGADANTVVLIRQLSAIGRIVVEWPDLTRYSSKVLQAALLGYIVKQIIYWPMLQVWRGMRLIRVDTMNIGRFTIMAGVDRDCMHLSETRCGGFSFEILYCQLSQYQTDSRLIRHHILCLDITPI